MEKPKKYDDYYKAREVITRILSQDLEGPVFNDEILIENPVQYYVTGKLYPCGDDVQTPDISQTASIDSSINGYDVSLESTNMRNPSAMGITFTLKSGIDEVLVKINYALYRRYNREDILKTGLDIERYQDKLNDDINFWVRNAYTEEIRTPINKNYQKELAGGALFESYTHKKCQNGDCIITMVLVNNNCSVKDYERNAENTIFQPKIRVESPKEEKRIFSSATREVEVKRNKELINLDLLYSEYKCYGQGHGCSVEWGDITDDITHEPEYLQSVFIPEYKLQQMKAVKFDDNPVVRMKYIYTEKPENVIEQLYKFTERYKIWIERMGNSITSLKQEYAECARNNLKDCKNAFDRMNHSIDLLSVSIHTDNKIWRAFCIANEAMLMQRQHSLIVQGKKTLPENEIMWYPFQIAFILQELSSIIEPQKDDRKIVDLLWFPTGGGKTEAYLGIAAFTIIYRRMMHQKDGAGVTVIMRYTLRLLTIQQFQRASTLICACEVLRQKYNFSDKKIEIGLWVGNELTPRDIVKAKTNLNKLQNGESLPDDEPNPCQVKRCPWCGAELTATDYSIDSQTGTMRIKCSNHNCDFNNLGQLPIRLTDEEIYRETPSFILATVDKFAQIPLNSNSAKLFGVDTKNRPPELIIQDELHLISGPLGTMVGIYEAAINNICLSQGVSIKIIASTATIRNADSQIKSLYAKDYKQFPPMGITADDSFFAEKASRDEKPERQYVGVMGVGTSFTTTLIRVYAAWLFASRYLIDLGYKESVIDNYWTLIGYFNSLRELGGAKTQLVDDIQSRYKYLKEKKFAHLTFTGEETYDHNDELTSRKNNNELSDIIQKRLTKAYTSNDHTDVYDFVLSTNMISVGVDVGRLGTMIMAGQPKTNAEYIQATSRIGRDNPGLAIIIYNSGKSRDRSHYEQFLRYHSGLYRYVEATSLTPFSDRARDRGLQALFVTMCRDMIPELRDDDSAGNFNMCDEKVQNIKAMILAYVNDVDPNEKENVSDELDEICEEWQEMTDGKLYYKYGRPALLKEDIDENSRFRMMNSMRSVEEQSGIYLIGG